MMNVTLARIRTKTENAKQKLKAISRLTTTKAYSDAGAGLAAESVL
jgi:hypothetical protein